MGIFVLLGWPFTTHAAGTGSVSMSVSSQNVNIGDTVTVSVQALGPSGETAVAVMNIGFDSKVFQFVSCSDSAYGGGGSNVSVTTDAATVTLKAIAEGQSNISVSAYNGVVYSSNKDIDSMNGASTSVAVNNAVSADMAETTNLSDDNSLSSLTLSEGNLSPTFQGSTTKYTATVPYDVTEVKVSAKTTNEKAEITSVSGNTDLKVGTNNISVVVKAENGTTATYTIALTRSEANDSAEKTEEKTVEDTNQAREIMVGDTNYTISEEFTEEDIPRDFSKAMVTYLGNEYQGLKFDFGELYLLYMVPQEGKGKFFVCDQTDEILYSFIRLQCGEHYIMFLMPPEDAEIPEGYTQTVLTVSQQDQITAFASDENADYDLVYAMNKEGTTGWYQYDTIEGTYQRYQENDTIVPEQEEGSLSTEDGNDLYQQYTKVKNQNNMILIVMIVCLFALFISAVLLILRKKVSLSDDFKGDDDSDDVSEYEEEPYEESEELYDEEEPYEESEELYDEEEPYEESEELYDEEESYEESDELHDEEESYEDLEIQEENVLLKKKEKSRKAKVRRGKNVSKKKADDELEVIDLNDL